MPWKIYSPSTAEQRELCIHEYAEITKDPSVCALLMPSDYGWSCLGVARKTSEACSIDYGKTVSWPSGDITNNQWEEASMADCITGAFQSDQGQKCCYLLRLTSDPNINDCSMFKDDNSFMDLCLSQLSMKTKNITLCADISDENKRSICEVRARALDE